MPAARVIPEAKLLSMALRLIALREPSRPNPTPGLHKPDKSRRDFFEGFKRKKKPPPTLRSAAALFIQKQLVLCCDLAITQHQQPDIRTM
ncbi:hypothetical protein RDV84_14325 [Lysobacter yananisis]|uniref:Uncharacterized protein n=1 Tax=Lysobacter yananisis TaxID=1003114 RepID=A0ABY9P2I4_9GAMM|nr:hypothetical protein [Lysobacter yananisis]WMT01173.1 hypothetical protein RDV84_14325 [Lysobacter yananisis]